MKESPKWGYDLDAVPAMRCLTCGDLIGEEEYDEETALARFGQIMFRHARCSKNKVSTNIHMKKIAPQIKFRCVFCGLEYGTVEECNACEQSH